ncbi:MAG: hypothetical protein FJZ90_05990 [Chloroflexi bacterium]|nr:hypothetical protein [Chloroflexota bacterium]
MAKAVRCGMALCLLSLALAAACKPDPRKAVPIVVASARSAEQQLLGQVTIVYLRELGYQIEDKTSLGSSAMVRRALEAGNVDLCWEYTGVTWGEHLARDQPIMDSDELYRRVREEDLGKGIVWLPPSATRYTPVLAMEKGRAAERKLTSISQLADYINKVNPDVRLCTPPELHDTARGIRGLERVYSFRFKPGLIRHVSAERGFEQLRTGLCDCAFGYTTEAASVQGLQWLRDDRAFSPASDLAVGVRASVLGALPELEPELVRLAKAITQENLARLASQAAAPDVKLETIARRFLSDQGLIGRRRTSTETPSPTP